MSLAKKDLPPVPKLWQTIGPSFILLGLALGSGELILWPYLTAKWGLGLVWGAALGITFQFILNTEVMRYSLSWGESVFVGFKKLFRLLPLWFIISTFIPWGMPGFSSASAQILTRLFYLTNPTVVAVFILLLVGTVLTVGKTLYTTMEHVQKIAISFGLPLIIVLVAIFARPQDFNELALGLVGKGQGWWFFPQGIAIFSFLGAFAYAGAGGNLNLAQSYYVKEKGLGMGKYSAKITSILSGGEKEVSLEGQTFPLTKKNIKRWQLLWRIVNLEHGLIFWFLGFFTIVLLAVLAKALVYGHADATGIEFLYQEAAAIGSRLGQVFGKLFLFMAALMLYTTQTGVLESSSRIISENILLAFHKEGEKVNASLFFYLALWGQILLGIVLLLLGVREPRFLLTLAAVLNAVAMMVSFPLVYFLNKTRLPKSLHPGLGRSFLMLAAFCFFVVFSAMTLSQI